VPIVLRLLRTVTCLVVIVWAAPALLAQDGDTTDAPAPPAARVSDGLSLGGFLGDIESNSLALFSKRNIAPLFIATGGALAAHTADASVRDYFSSTPRLGPLEPVGNQFGRLLVVASTVGGLVAVGDMQGNEKFRQFTYDLGQATAIGGLVTGGTKLAAGRPRPTGSSRVSFPSGHTTSAFAAATVTAHYYGAKAAIPGYLAATLVGVSRLDADKHYLSDVVAGAAIGYIVGRTVTRRSREPDARLTWTPVVSPATGSFGIGVSWRLGE
jgi:hypothetical protein